MEYLFDLHTHTVASGHAYSTLTENMEEAYAKGLRAYGFSDHSEAMPGSCSNMFFANFKVIPREYKGMLILRGVEANIMDYHGGLDIDETILEKLDYVIASLHTLCIEPGTLTENMEAYFGAMTNPYVRVLGHPDDGRYPLDYDALAKKAAETGVTLELNNSSLSPDSARVGGVENAISMLRSARKYDTYIICNTDSHHASYVGDFESCDRLLEELKFPKELVINNSMEKLTKVLNKSIDLKVSSGKA